MIKRKGFTLVELLVVGIVVGLLIVSALMVLGSARQKARDAKRLVDVRELRSSLQSYFNDRDAYPTGTNLMLGAGKDCGTGTTCTAISSTNGIASTAAGTIYMTTINSDPSAPVAAKCTSNSGSVCNYSYSVVNVGTGAVADGYEIYFFLEAPIGGLANGLNCATEAGVGSTCIH